MENEVKKPDNIDGCMQIIVVIVSIISIIFCLSVLF